MAKHPVPKQRKSASNKRHRASKWKREAQVKLKNRVQVTTCKNCGETCQQHCVCAACGFYGKTDVLGRTETAAAPAPEEIQTIKAD